MGECWRLSAQARPNCFSTPTPPHIAHALGHQPTERDDASLSDVSSVHWNTAGTTATWDHTSASENLSFGCARVSDSAWSVTDGLPTRMTDRDLTNSQRRGQETRAEHRASSEGRRPKRALTASALQLRHTSHTRLPFNRWQSDDTSSSDVSSANRSTAGTTTTRDHTSASENLSGAWCHTFGAHRATTRHPKQFAVAILSPETCVDTSLSDASFVCRNISGTQ